MSAGQSSERRAKAASHDGPRSVRRAAEPTTFVSERRRVEEQKRQPTLARLFLVGNIAWPLFLLPDLLPVLITGDTSHLDWLIGLRALGETVALPAYVAFRYARKLSQLSMTIIDA